jgi:5-methylcytosine-specific restriction endonuclease McrA
LCDKKYREENKNRIAVKMKRYREENGNKISEVKKRWCEENKEQTASYKKQWYENNKENIALKNKHRYEENREQSLLRQKQWRDGNKEKIAQRDKRYLKTPTGKLIRKNASHRRRTITKQGDVTTVQLKQLLENSTHCFYCNNPLILNEIHIDHYIPLAKGGLHTISNLRVACKKCNLSKWDKMPKEFLNYLEKGKGM